VSRPPPRVNRYFPRAPLRVSRGLHQLGGVRNQALLAANAYGRSGDTKSGRGGHALLAGLISCTRRGHRLNVVYTGRYPRPLYRCDKPNLQLGRRRCFSFGGKHIDKIIATEMLRAVAPMAIEAGQGGRTYAER
jgi:hypothetical protein